MACAGGRGSVCSISSIALLERLALGVVGGVGRDGRGHFLPGDPQRRSPAPATSFFCAGVRSFAGIAITARSSAVSMACFASASALR